MAALESTAVSKLSRHSAAGAQSLQLVTKRLALVLTGQGTVASPIDAETLGFRSIVNSSPAVASDDSLVIATSPSADGSKLLLKAAGTNAPATYTGITIHVTVVGRSR